MEVEVISERPSTQVFIQLLVGFCANLSQFKEIKLSIWSLNSSTMGGKKLKDALDSLLQNKWRINNAKNAVEMHVEYSTNEFEKTTKIKSNSRHMNSTKMKQPYEGVILVVAHIKTWDKQSLMNTIWKDRHNLQWRYLLRSRSRSRPYSLSRS